MAHAFASGFPGMADNLVGDLGQSSHSEFSQALHNNNAGQSMSSMYANEVQRSLNASSVQHAEYGVNGVSGLGSTQQNWHAQQASMQPSGLNAYGTDYDTFLANNGLGVKSQRPQVPGMPPLSRGGSGMDLLAAGQQNGTAQQRRPPNIQQMFANMTRSPSNGQLAALKPYLPPGLSDEQAFSRGLQAGVPTAALLPQGYNTVGQPPPRSDNRTPPLAPAAQDYNGEPGRDGGWPPREGNHLVSQSSGLSNAYSGAANLAPADIQQLLNSMGNYPASMPEQISRPASRASNVGGPSASRHPSGASLAEILAAQPKGSSGAASTAQDFPAGVSPPDGQGMDGPPSPKPELGREGPPPATTAAAESETESGRSAFAAVANVALDEGVPEDANGQPPASTVSTMAGQAPLAPNLFDPSYAVPTGNAALNNHLMDPASLAASAGGAAARAPELAGGLGGLDMTAMQQLQQQLGGNASYNEIMEAMRMNAQQQALAQQRMQAARAGAGQVPGGLSMANPAAGNMTGMAGYTNQDLLKQQADRAGILGRNAMLQQLNKGQLPQQQPAPGRNMASPAGGLPYGMPEQRLQGMDNFGSTHPKPQPSPQQMRFGGNIGVHAINRTSAQLPGQPQAQNRAMMGGLGLNNPLTAGLAGTVAGPPRPGLKPNWQAQRVQTHAQAAVAAQQAAQVQQVQAMRLAAAKAQAQAQLNAQLQAQAQAAQAQANRNNLLAGLTPAQLNMLMNAPPQQLNQMAAQLGLLDPNPGVAGLGGVPNAGLGGMGLAQQQKLMAAAAAARGGYAPQPPQRQAARPMLSQQQLQQLYAQQAAQQAAQQGRVTPSLLNNPALAGLGGAQPPGGVQNTLGQSGGATNTRAALVDMGRGLAQAGFTVEQAVNSGLLGGFSAFDVRALSEGHQAEVARMRAARAAAQQNAQANAQQQLAQQHYLRQTQLQQLQQAQQAQATAATASYAGSDPGSHSGTTPKTPAPIMNLGPGSLGQLFDWQPSQGQQAPASQDLLSSNWDLTSTQLQGGQSAAQSQLGPALSLGGISGPIEASLGVGLGPIAPRPSSDAGGSDAPFPPTLRSRSPWEGGHGGGLGAIQPGSARSGISSHATTPRSRPGTMSSLLEMGSVFGPPTGQPPIKYASQGSLDGELPSHMRGAPGAQAPIGEGRAARSGQGEVPASLRAFWESGGLGAADASGRPLAKSISLDSARPPASSVAGAQGLPTAGNAMEPAMDLEALDAALEAAANAANATTESSAPLEPVAPAELDSFTAASYSFFNMQSSLADPAAALGTLSLEGELEGDAGSGKDSRGGLLDDTGMTEMAEDASKSAL